jgi:hypothetical protein
MGSTQINPHLCPHINKETSIDLTVQDSGEEVPKEEEGEGFLDNPKHNPRTRCRVPGCRMLRRKLSNQLPGKVMMRLLRTTIFMLFVSTVVR